MKFLEEKNMANIKLFKNNDEYESMVQRVYRQITTVDRKCGAFRFSDEQYCRFVKEVEGFCYTLIYTKELWIDRRENSKSLAWSSVLLALGNVKEVGAVVDRPKALGDIRGVTYIYGMFYRFGLINVPDEVKEKMNKCGCVAKG